MRRGRRRGKRERERESWTPVVGPSLTKQVSGPVNCVSSDTTQGKVYGSDIAETCRLKGTISVRDFQVSCYENTSIEIAVWNMNVAHIFERSEKKYMQAFLNITVYFLYIYLDSFTF